MKLAATAAVVAMAATTVTTSAEAAEPNGVDWMKVLVDADHLARGKELKAPPPTLPNQVQRPTMSEDPSTQSLGNAWFGVAPRASLAFRDWQSSTRIAGDQLSLAEAMRLSNSTRMLVGRARLSGTRFAPFIQVGLGQWRTDNRFLPLTKHTIEIASQFGGGFELRLARRWQIAAESSVISLIREQGDINVSVPTRMLWSTFIASRIEF